MTRRRLLSAMLSWTGFAGVAFAAPHGGHTLAVEQSFRIALTEVSGLAENRHAPAGREIYAVGDASYGIGVLTIERSPASPRIATVDARALLDADAKDPSQWEAVATDGRGTVCIEAEVSATVVCLDADLQKRSASFTLDPSTIASLGDSWRSEPNSRGEGMVLMKRGHLLLLKEKKPSLLVEFGAAGEAPLGVAPHTLLAEREAFALPADRRLVALKVWQFSKSLRSLAKDASDITVGPDRRLYLLSDESARLIRLEGRLRVDEASVHDTASWKLPAAIAKPEGLVIDDDMRPWIAVDGKDEDRPNVFRLTPIGAP